MITNRLKLIIGAVAIAATAVGTTAVMYSNNPKVDGQLYATPGAFECSRTLTAENIEHVENAQGGSSYTDWVYQPADYKYIGQTACGGGKTGTEFGSVIQLRSNNSNSGIITQGTSLGLMSIELEWNTATTTGRTVEIYGRIDEQYSAPSDLYNNGDEKLGEIVYGTSTSLVLDKKYTSYGLRSKSSALYLDSITFNWTNALPAAEKPETPPEQSSSSSSSSSSGSSSESSSASWNLDAEMITFADLGLTNGVQYSNPFDLGHATIQFTGGGNDGKYYTTGSGIRTYGGGSIVITSTYDIKSLQFTWDGSNKPSTDNANPSGYSATDNVWSGSAKSITLTRPSGSGHWRLKTVIVNYK